MQRSRINWSRNLDLESEHWYATDTAVLLFGSSIAFIALVLIKVIVQPRGNFFIGVVLVLALITLAVCTIGSLVFLFWRIRKYGLPLVVVPLVINLTTIALCDLLGERRLYLTDPGLITDSRQYSSDGQYMAFAYTLNDGPLGTPTYEAVVATSDTTVNLSSRRIPRGLSFHNWNADNSLNVECYRNSREDHVAYKVGDTVVVNGITLRVVQSIN